MRPLAAIGSGGRRVWPSDPRAGALGRLCSRCGGRVRLEHRRFAPPAFVCPRGCQSPVADFAADFCADGRFRVQAVCPSCPKPNRRHTLFTGEEGVVAVTVADMGLVLYSAATKRALCVLSDDPDPAIEARMGWHCPVVAVERWNGGWWLDAAAPRRCRKCLRPPGARARRLAATAVAKWKRVAPRARSVNPRHDPMKVWGMLYCRPYGQAGSIEHCIKEIKIAMARLAPGSCRDSRTLRPPGVGRVPAPGLKCIARPKNNQQRLGLSSPPPCLARRGATQR